MPQFKVRLLLSTAVVLVLFSLVPGCTRSPDLDSRISEVTAPYRFRLLDWEIKTLVDELFDGRTTTDNSTLNEKLLEKRVREAFSDQGIFNPLDRFFTVKIGFPPINIYLGNPPRQLVVSPRDRIENIRAILLQPDIDVEAMEAIEAEIDGLGYSSLVVGLGGLSTFPSYITDDADIRFILDTTAHEWLHLYLTFTPLGFLKLLDTLGLRRDYDIATMNETVANIIGKEIGEIVYRKYYAPPEPNNATPETPKTGFDFNKVMHETRLAVDDYLARGEIEAAEVYMEQRRQYLVANGYHIRKLNQAYFAFHGTYADTPASSSPIGAEMKQLRAESDSLKDFLDRVSAMGSRQDLAEAVR